jgi:hypothetical protein
VIALLPVVARLLLRAFLLKLRAFPKIGVQLFVFLAVYAAIVTAAGSIRRGRWILAGIALLATALDRWRSPGRRTDAPAGAPPGSLAIAPIGPWSIKRIT